MLSGLCPSSGSVAFYVDKMDLFMEQFVMHLGFSYCKVKTSTSFHYLYKWFLNYVMLSIKCLSGIMKNYFAWSKLITTVAICETHYFLFNTATVLVTVSASVLSLTKCLGTFTSSMINIICIIIMRRTISQYHVIFHIMKFKLSILQGNEFHYIQGLCFGLGN